MRTALAPLLVCLALPGFSGQEEAKKTAGIKLWPLLEVIRSGEPAAREVEILWPLFKWQQGPESRRLRIFPFLWSGRERKDHIEKQHFHLWPFYGYSQKGEHYRAEHVAWPLFSNVRDGSRRAYGVVPFFWMDRTPRSGARTYWVPPVLSSSGTWRSRHGDLVFGELFYVLPFFMSFLAHTESSGGLEATCFFPFYDLVLTGRTKSGLGPYSARIRSVIWVPYYMDFPIPSRDTEQDVGRAQLVPPFGYVRRRDDRALGLPWPLVILEWNTRTPDGALTLFPVFSVRRSGEFRGSSWLWYSPKSSDGQLIREHVVLWKLINYQRRKNGDYDFRIAHFLFNNRLEGQKRRTSLLWPLIQYEREEGKRRLRFFDVLKLPI